MKNMNTHLKKPALVNRSGKTYGVTGTKYCRRPVLFRIICFLLCAVLIDALNVMTCPRQNAYAANAEEDLRIAANAEEDLQIIVSAEKGIQIAVNTEDGLQITANAEKDPQIAENTEENPQNEEKTSRAAYLQAGLYESVSEYTHGRELIEEMEKCATVELSPEEYHDFVYSVAPEQSFSALQETAEKRGAVAAGTFLPEADCREQFRFLTEVNGFPAFAADRFKLAGGTSFEMCPGDLIFWLDENGEAVNTGLVCSLHRTYSVAAVDNPEKGTALLRLSTDTLDYLKNFTIVRPFYSSVEQQIYLYCRNVMGYTRTGACGILANIACESGFKTGVEEWEQKMGIGICQWSYERREDLNEFCEENGLEITELDSQLKFMQFELENRYSFTGDFLKTVPEDPTGAYDAGYWVCFEYEQPVDFEFVSDDRARLSVDSYWPVYCNAG